MNLKVPSLILTSAAGVHVWLHFCMYTSLVSGTCSVHFGMRQWQPKRKFSFVQRRYRLGTSDVLQKVKGTYDQKYKILTVVFRLIHRVGVFGSKTLVETLFERINVCEHPLSCHRTVSLVRSSICKAYTRKQDVFISEAVMYVSPFWALYITKMKKVESFLDYVVLLANGTLNVGPCFMFR